QLRFDAESNTLKMIEARPSPDHEYIDGQWVLSAEASKRIQVIEEFSLLQQKRDELHAIETQIQRYERIKKRTETEEQELDALIDQATVLFREIKGKEIEEKGESQ